MIHAGVRLSLEQNRDVVAVDFEANGLFQSDGVGLMGRLIQHRRESEKFAVRRFIDHHFLLILVDGGDPHLAGNHHVGLAAGVAHLVDALARRKCLQFDLSRQDGSLIVVEQGRTAGPVSTPQGYTPCITS